MVGVRKMPPKRPKTPWDPDLRDPDVRRWQENLSRGSASTGDAWFRALRRFCAETHRTPIELLKLDMKALRDLFADFASSDTAKGARGSYTAYTLKVVRNWLKFNGITPPSGVKVKGAGSVFEETALSPEQLRAALNAATPRERVAIVLMAQSGVRPEVIGSFMGTDGLRVKDFPELSIKGTTVFLERTPTPIFIRQELSKATHKYVTFIGEEGGKIIVDYLQSRLSTGEKVSADSPIFPPERVDLTNRAFVRTTKIGDSIRHAFRTAGLTNRPYVLRTTAASRFAEAENRGWVPHSFWQHWMGHSGDMSARYSVNRGRIPQSLLDEMRAAYHRCEPILSTMTIKQDTQDAASKVIRLLLEARGVPKEKLDKLDIGSMSDEEIVALVKTIGASPGTEKKMTQRVVPADDAPKLIEEGWEFAGSLKNGDLAVLRAPHA